MKIERAVRSESKSKSKLNELIPVGPTFSSLFSLARACVRGDIAPLNCSFLFLFLLLVSCTGVLNVGESI